MGGGGGVEVEERKGKRETCACKKDCRDSFTDNASTLGLEFDGTLRLYFCLFVFDGF